MAFKPDQHNSKKATSRVQTEAQRRSSQELEDHNKKIGRPALGLVLGAAVAASPIVSEHLDPQNSLQDLVTRTVSGDDVQQANTEELRRQGIEMERGKSGSVVVRLAEQQTAPSVPETTPTGPERSIKTLPPSESNPYTTLVFDTKELNKHFDGSKALGGLLKVWLGSEPIDNERQVTPAALIKSMLARAIQNNPAMQRVLSETFLSPAMIEYFKREMARDQSLQPLLIPAIDSQNAPTMAAAWYELKLRESGVEQGGGRGGGIHRTTLSELNTEYNSFRSLTYPNSPKARQAIMERFNLNAEEYKVFLEYIQAMSFDIFGALPYTEMIPGNDWDANREVMEVILDKLGSNFAVVMPTFAGSKKRPSSALGIHQNTESNALAQASFFWPLVYSVQTTPQSHADVLLTHSNPLHSQMAIAYFDKWFHIIDFIKRSGVENARIMIDPKHKTEFAQFAAGLHYQPETAKKAATTWAAQVRTTAEPKTLLSIISNTDAEVEDLATYMTRNGNHAKALAAKLDLSPTTNVASSNDQ